MEPDAKYTLVGVIVLALLAGGIIFGLWLYRPGEGDRLDFYTVYFANQSLSGLQVDGGVTMKGLKVGTVKSVEITPTDIEKARVIIGLQGDTPIKLDTRAVIQRNLLTGLAFIDLVGSTQAAGRLTKRAAGEDFPVIPEGITRLEEIQSAVPSLVESANIFIARATTFFSPENEAAIGKILANLARISERLASGDKGVALLLDELQKLVAELRQVLSSVGPEIKGAARSIQEMSDSLSRSAAAVSQSVKVLSNKAGATAEELRDPRAVLFGSPKDALGPGE